MTLQRDAYQVLQVDPRALPEVIEAAYRALARLHHPDTNRSPDASRRMAELNQAYDAVRTPDRRKAYDQLRAGAAGRGDRQAAAKAPSASTVVPPPPRRKDEGSDAAVLDFGRYQGWSLRDLARHDPDYLHWLSRHSAGSRFRRQIAAELERRTAAQR